MRLGIYENPNFAAFNLKKNKQAQGMLHLHLHDKDIRIHPEFLRGTCHNDAEMLEDFLESLHDDEQRIIEQHGHNLPVLIKLKERADRDVEDTAKALAME